MDASSVLSYKQLMALLISLEETVALMHWSLFWFIVYESFFHFSANCHADMQLVVNCSKGFCHTLFVQWLTDSCVKSSMSLMSILIWTVYHQKCSTRSFAVLFWYFKAGTNLQSKIQVSFHSLRKGTEIFNNKEKVKRIRGKGGGSNTWTSKFQI